VLALVACGDDDERSGLTNRDVERYCDVVRPLDEAGSEAFEELENDPEATEEEYAAAEQAFLEKHEAEIQRLIDLAPEEIAEDVETLIALTLEGARGTPEFAEVEVRIQAFEDEYCG
jgi:hypothetical protein